MENCPDGEIPDIWQPKFDYKESFKFATYGSCFAQYFGLALKENGLNWLLTEDLPPLFSDREARDLGYRIFSSRTQNIYTVSYLNQLISWTKEANIVPKHFWPKGDHLIDPFRPTIEPNGFPNERELFASRMETIKRFKQSIELSNVFVFTMGLTEGWHNIEHDYEYAICPGTLAGEFKSSRDVHFNHTVDRIREDMVKAIQGLLEINRDLLILLTVSPVPLVATFSETNVLLESLLAKAKLRVVADEMTKRFDMVDYFPSFEIISGHQSQGVFFEEDRRTVKPKGVELVMRHFFKAAYAKNTFDRGSDVGPNEVEAEQDDPACLEMMAYKGRT